MSFKEADEWQKMRTAKFQAPPIYLDDYVDAGLHPLLSSTPLATHEIFRATRSTSVTGNGCSAAWETSEKLPQPWPSSGEINFSNLGFKYRPELQLTLKNLSILVNPGEKIGIVGRTGAGKSSLTLALFRIVEPAQGKISIDGVDIAAVGLHQLRSSLTIIPQDPVLFSGSLRYNLDPLDSFTDEQIWQCLEMSHLKQYVMSLPQKLQHSVAEGGDNMSVGQKQLVCLARAVLKKTKILILDEATAAMDLQTDHLIQATIRQHFADSTVLTIAHRLNTILDSDRILVLERGQMLEFDTPTTLLSNQATSFFLMAKEAKLI